MPPLSSTITICTEVLITIAVFTVLYRGYVKNIFSRYIALGALCYEVAFNISYMLDRLLFDPPVEEAVASPVYLALAAFHGIFSLIMFVALVVFFGLAWRGYLRGINYFRQHARITLVFALCWAVAILSGMFLYWFTYLS